MERKTWQKLRIFGWLLVCIPLFFRVLQELYSKGYTLESIGYFSALIGTILVAIGYWYGEMNFRSTG